MQGLKTMFLGFIMIFMGAMWLLVLSTSLPADAPPSSPLVALFFDTNPCVQTSQNTFTCGGYTDQREHLLEVIQAQTGWAITCIVSGFVLAVIGLFLKDRRFAGAVVPPGPLGGPSVPPSSTNQSSTTPGNTSPGP